LRSDAVCPGDAVKGLAPGNRVRGRRFGTGWRDRKGEQQNASEQ
jgi:hypothetical protein